MINFGVVRIDFFRFFKIFRRFRQIPGLIFRRADFIKSVGFLLHILILFLNGAPASGQHAQDSETCHNVATHNHPPSPRRRNYDFRLAVGDFMNNCTFSLIKLLLL